MKKKNPVVHFDCESRGGPKFYYNNYRDIDLSGSRISNSIGSSRGVMIMQSVVR